MYAQSCILNFFMGKFQKSMEISAMASVCFVRNVQNFKFFQTQSCSAATKKLQRPLYATFRLIKFTRFSGLKFPGFYAAQLPPGVLWGAARTLQFDFLCMVKGKSRHDYVLQTCRVCKVVWVNEFASVCTKFLAY